MPASTFLYLLLFGINYVYSTKISSVKWVSNQSIEFTFDTDAIAPALIDLKNVKEESDCSFFGQLGNDSSSRVTVIGEPTFEISSRKYFV